MHSWKLNSLRRELLETLKGCKNWSRKKRGGGRGIKKRENNMDFGKQVSANVISKILSNPFERMFFLKEYEFFDRDGNARQYNDYALSVIKNSRDVVAVSDAIILSTKTHQFSKSVFKQIRIMLYSRRNYIVKLACLDFLLAFKEEIPKRYFFQINNRILSHSRNNLLRIQATLNLISIDANFSSKLIALLYVANSPTEFYRVINGLQCDDIRLDAEEIERLKGMIVQKPFKKQVKIELLSRLENL